MSITSKCVKSLFRADVMASSLLVGAPGMRFIRREQCGDDAEDDPAAAAGEGSDTAAMASSSVMRKLSFKTTVNCVAAIGKSDVRENEYWNMY